MGGGGGSEIRPTLHKGQKVCPKHGCYLHIASVLSHVGTENNASIIGMILSILGGLSAVIDVVSTLQLLQMKIDKSDAVVLLNSPVQSDYSGSVYGSC